MNTSIVSPGVLRVPLSQRSKTLKQDPVIVQYAFTDHAIYGQDVIDMTLQSITIYASWFMGFVTLRAKQKKKRKTNNLTATNDHRLLVVFSIVSFCR